MLTVIDSAIESNSVFTVVNNASVNPVPATAFQVNQLSDCLQLYVVGPANAGALCAIDRPVFSQCSNVTFSGKFWVDESASFFAGEHEFDVKVAISNYIYNGSFQINRKENCMLQIATASGSWVDTGFTISAPPVEQWVPFSTRMQFNQTTHTFSMINLSVGSQTFIVPSTLQNIACSQPSPAWADTAAIQIQLGLGTQAGAFSTKVQGLQLTWV